MTTERCSFARDKRGGFSLLEILLASAVLSILVVILAQVVSMTNKVINFNSRELDAAAQARTVFSRMAADFAARPRRRDLGMTFTKAKGNDNFLIYSGVDGYSGTRRVTAINYHIQQTTAGRIYQLERGATGADWTTAGNQLLFQPQAVPSPNEADYEVLSSGVFRMEFAYLLNTGAISNSPQGKSDTDYSNVSGIVVCIAILDSRSRQMLSSDQLAQIANSLTDSTEGQDPLSSWTVIITNKDFMKSIPPSAIQNLRLYQRVFYVP